jgi:hypothetical protein
MQDVSGHGLVTATSANLVDRCTIMTVHGAPEALVESLIEEWSNCTARKAYEKLSSADVRVTNQADKDVQLAKILELDSSVAAVASRKGIHREPSPDPVQATGAETSWEREPTIERRRTY